MKKTRLPDDFKVSDQVMKLARQNNWPDPRREVDAFKDYHLAHGSLMLDWEAAFRTWLRNTQKWSKAKPLSLPPDVVSAKPKPTEARPKEVAQVRSLLSNLVDKFDVRKKA